jgi:NTP pyrophosphatase (non-canonical NTP hydrolase)
MAATADWTLQRLQAHIRTLYGDKDAARGIEGTFMWFMEEVGELASSLRGDPQHPLAEEFADVLAWLATLANVAGVDLTRAVAAKYGPGCPGCGQNPCACGLTEKP